MIFSLTELPSHDSVENKVDAAKNKPRSSEWLAAASIKLLPLIEQLGKLYGCDSNDIREELSILVRTLLTHCQR